MLHSYGSRDGVVSVSQILGPDGQPLHYSTFLQEAMLLANEVQKRKEREEAAKRKEMEYHRRMDLIAEVAMTILAISMWATTIWAIFVRR